MMQNPNTIEKIAEGVTREWLDDGAIAVYTIYNTKRTTADIWADAMLKVVAEMSPNTPYLALYDITRVVSLTPYARTKALEVATQLYTRQIHGRSCVLLSNNVLSQVLRLFMLRDLAGGTMERGVFLKREPALAWLREILV
jgi:hypothetical protein